MHTELYDVRAVIIMQNVSFTINCFIFFLVFCIVIIFVCCMIFFMYIISLIFFTIQNAMQQTENHDRRKRSLW